MITLEEIQEQRERVQALYARSSKIQRAAAEERSKLHEMRKQYLKQQERSSDTDTDNHPGP